MIKIKTSMSSFSDQIYNLYSDTEGKDKKVKTLTFQVTDDCCMKCTYCYQINKAHHSMSFEIAKNFIDQLLDLNNPLEYFNPYTNTLGIIIEFIGGEPLMEIDLIQQICDYITIQMYKKNHPWLLKHRFSICSNGLLYFQPKVQDFFKKYYNRLSFSISIDGNKELHDACRIDLLGRGTYDRALKAMQHYVENYHGRLSTKMTLSPENINYTSEAIINLINLGYEEISANCIFEEGWTLEHAKIFYSELKKITNFICEHDELNQELTLTLFSDTAFSPISSDNNWCGGVGENMLAIDYKGDFYPCIRYMESSLGNSREPIIIGNINKGFYTTEKEKKFQEMLNNVTKTEQSTQECLECPIESGCAWCSGYNYQCFGTVKKRATYICIMHQARALGNLYFWSHYNPKKNFTINLEKEKILKIISLEEYQQLFKKN